MIKRFGQEQRTRTPERPVGPSLRQEWIGSLGFLGLIIFIDRFSTYVYQLTFAFLIYIVAIIFVGSWGGLRAAIASSASLTIYAWLVFTYPISIIGKFGTQLAQRNAAVLWTAIIFPIFGITAAVVQNKLREAAIREFEANAIASSESEHRRIAEAELWASEEMRRLIVDSSVDAVIGMSEDGAITVWNPNAEKLFGWTQAEAIGSHVAERILPPKTKRGRQAGLRWFRESGEGPILRTHIELTAQTKFGEEISVELYVADHKTESGSVFIAFARDISERKTAQRAIEDLNSRLEERVAERTAQLEAANEELIGFTYSVSHDLRAPLRAIVANSRIVCEDAKDTLDDVAIEHLQRLENNALKMAELIENLLQFARIGQVALTFQEVDLSAMADGIAKDLKSAKNGSISIEPGMVVQGDPEMLKMVLVNLMENSWKYVRPGQNPNVKVGTTPEGIFYVQDEGIGFDMAYVDKIWEPFERLHREDDYPGTGIGLANSKRIVLRHGGKIWTESAPGEGTTMFFELSHPPQEGPPELASA